MVFKKVNKELLPMKAHYFLLNAGTGTIVPFLPPIARQLGFSTSLVGFIYTLPSILGMIAKPTLGAIADRYNCQRSLFLLAILISCIGFFSMSFVPPIVIHSKVHLRCDAITVFSIGATDGYRGDCEKSYFLEELMQRDNFVLSCNMICMSNNASSFALQICHLWGNPDFCLNDARNVNQVSFVAKADISDKKMEYIGKTSHVASKRRESQYRLASEFHPKDYFDFRAEIDSAHIEPVENLIYFRIKRAYFHSGQDYLPYCSGNHTATCQVSCNDKWVEEMVAKTTADDTRLSNSEALRFYQFWMFFSLLVISLVSFAAVVSVSDAICFQLLGDRPEDYGLQRVWGAIGWSILSIFAGMLVDWKSKGSNVKDYSPMFYMCAVALMIDLLVSSKIKVVQSKLSSNIVRDVRKLLCDVRIIVFLLWCIIIGMCTASVWQFLFLFLDELATKIGCKAKDWIVTLEALSMFVTCFGGELPFFFCSGWILRKLGHAHCMSLVLIAFGVRFLLYSILTDPWYSLPIELLNGLTFGVFYTTMASYASIIAPPGTETSVQGLVGAAFEGVGVSFGNIVGGLLFGWYGGSALYRIFGIGCCLLFVLHVMLQKLIETRYRRGSANKDVATNAIYTSPTEAIHMLESESVDPIT